MDNFERPLISEVNIRLTSIILIAIALAMDAFAVSIASGIQLKKVKLRHALKIAFFFGFFQALMPLIGSTAGSKIKPLISGVDHWVAVILLTFIGIKMIYEACFIKKEAKKEQKNPLDFKILIVLAIATSIDALAVGFSLSLLMNNFLMAIAVIGITTFILSFIGVLLGDLTGHLFEEKIEIAGGILLIFIGMKILLEHIWS